jgi:NTP pyrophosphatase (non-canonical NTP hydrolase)
MDSFIDVVLKDQQPNEDLRRSFEDENLSFDGGFSHWPSIVFYIRSACQSIHKANEKWWTDLHTGEPIQCNVGELLMLIVSEVAEGMEGHRKSLMDDKLPHRPMLEVEMADAVIRIFDLCEGLGLDLAGAMLEKCKFNAVRVDHTAAARLAPGGKAY